MSELSLVLRLRQELNRKLQLIGFKNQYWFKALLPLFVMVYSPFLFPMYAQAQKLSFKHFTTNEGLPENTGQAMLQDNKGFIWIGTQNGLSRFNAYEFKTYKHHPNDSLSISNNQVQDIFEDSQGFIWVATRKGLNRYDPNTEIFEPYYPDVNLSSDANWLQFGINEGLKGNIWFSNFNGFYCINNWAKKDILFYPAPKASAQEYPVMYRDTAGILWLGQGSNVYRFFNEQFQIENRVEGNIGAFGQSNEGLLIATSLGLHKKTSLGIELLTNSNDWKEGIPLFVEQDADQQLWLGTTQGLFVYQNNILTEKYLHNVNQSGSLSHNTTLCWLQDRQGLIWIGTSQGINQADPMHRQVQCFDTNSDGSIKLLNNNVQALAFDAQRHLWIGGPNGLLRIGFF